MDAAKVKPKNVARSIWVILSRSRRSQLYALMIEKFALVLLLVVFCIDAHASCSAYGEWALDTFAKGSRHREWGGYKSAAEQLSRFFIDRV